MRFVVENELQVSKTSLVKHGSGSGMQCGFLFIFLNEPEKLLGIDIAELCCLSAAEQSF